MRRSGDIAERLARIEETMATRDDIEELRGLIEGKGPAGVVRRSAARCWWPWPRGASRR